MSEPTIEYKGRQRGKMHDLHRERRAQEHRARKMLKQLEQALLSCGYQYDGVYNSRRAGYTGLRQRATVIEWRDGKIALGVPGGKKDKKSPHKTLRFRPVDEMGCLHLIQVARHLAPFVDHLENSLRHQVDELTRSIEIIDRMIEAVKGDPQPAEIESPPVS